MEAVVEKKKREPKPAAPPAFKVGDRVTVRAVVRVRFPGPGGRRFLHLLRGTVWEVVEVVPEGLRGRPRYRLKTPGFDYRTEKQEYQLRPAAEGR